ncbi:V-type ATP synthase subunit D, partial [Tepidanaerobacter syntrophicus]
MDSEAALDFSKKGYELLDKKRNVLIREMMGFMDRAEKLQDSIG